jgi:PIN domain nuclease of toxin-antitoxin system
MRLLLDTHVFLCFISADVRLPARWRDTIRGTLFWIERGEVAGKVGL